MFEARLSTESRTAGFNTETAPKVMPRSLWRAYPRAYPPWPIHEPIHLSTSLSTLPIHLECEPIHLAPPPLPPFPAPDSNSGFAARATILIFSRFSVKPHSIIPHLVPLLTLPEGLASEGGGWVTPKSSLDS